MFLFLPYTNTNTNCEVQQALLTAVEYLKRQVCQSDRLVTWTTRDIKESGENRGMTADFLNSSSPVISYALTSHNKLAECLRIPSLVYHFLPASSRFQPALRDFYILNPFFLFVSFPAWHDRLFVSTHSSLLVCSRQMEKLMITFARASFEALSDTSTQNCIPQNFKPNLILNQTEQFRLPVQCMCHLHFQNSEPGDVIQFTSLTRNSSHLSREKEYTKP